MLTGGLDVMGVLGNPDLVKVAGVGGRGIDATDKGLICGFVKLWDVSNVPSSSSFKTPFSAPSTMIIGGVDGKHCMSIVKDGLSCGPCLMLRLIPSPMRVMFLINERIGDVGLAGVHVVVSGTCES